MCSGVCDIVCDFVWCLQQNEEQKKLAAAKKRERKKRQKEKKKAKYVYSASVWCTPLVCGVLR